MKSIFESDGIIMEYICFGNGQKNLVIIPGLSIKSVSGFADAIEEAYKIFKEDYTVYLFDRRKNLPEKYGVKEMADDTAFAMKKLGINNADLFGVSQGGMISLCIAAYYPGLVRKLVVGSTAARVNKDGKKIIREWIGLAKEEKFSDLNETFAAYVYSEDFFDKYRDVILSSAENITKEDSERFIILAEGSVGFDIYDKLSGITCPVLVIGAKKDKIFGVGPTEEIAEKIGCESYIYGEYGHAVYDEAPDYKERIRSFFNG